jgi:ubiquinone/menaquinone biosynthesis C-methylase UbiE
MTKVDQLIAKAMSTSSEEEAITCLKFARKEAIKSGYTPKSADEPKKTSSSYDSYTIYDLQRKLQILENMYREAYNRGTYFMNEMTKAQLDREKFRSMYQDANFSKTNFKVAMIGAMVVAAVCFVFAIGMAL